MSEMTMNSSRTKMPVMTAMAACLFAVSSTLAFAQGAAAVLVAQIAGNLNTKSAKVGDSLMAKTLKPSKLNDGTPVPKGSQLIGTVVAVQSKQAGSGTSRMAIKFDRIQVKDGASHPIQGRIAAIGMVSGISADPTDGSLMSEAGTATSGIVSPQSGSLEPVINFVESPTESASYANFRFRPFSLQVL